VQAILVWTLPWQAGFGKYFVGATQTAVGYIRDLISRSFLWGLFGNRLRHTAAHFTLASVQYYMQWLSTICSSYMYSDILRSQSLNFINRDL